MNVHNLLFERPRKKKEKKRERSNLDDANDKKKKEGMNRNISNSGENRLGGR